MIDPELLTPWHHIKLECELGQFGVDPIPGILYCAVCQLSIYSMHSRNDVRWRFTVGRSLSIYLSLSLSLNWFRKNVHISNMSNSHLDRRNCIVWSWWSVIQTALSIWMIWQFDHWASYYILVSLDMTWHAFLAYLHLDGCNARCECANIQIIRVLNRDICMT